MFERAGGSVAERLADFEKWVSRPALLRFAVRYELFRRVLDVKGSIVECGVRGGGGVMAWAKLCSTFEPFAIHRRVIGFDTFEGFPSLAEQDRPAAPGARLAVQKVGGFRAEHDVHAELQELIALHDRGRILGRHAKVELVRGDACETIPQYVAAHRHLLVALLFLDFDLYAPTKTALQHLLPRMPKGAVLAFDEVNSAHWPGETEAMLEMLDLRSIELKKFPFDPNVAYAVL
ncbi:MAG: dTDP-6-deoxy-L-hexose 3-O-methyltransferase [Proteobacteria bacterium]|nr:MAG: dTDP-6-deoxy-L-hexose 3-O-methyltransferase [Pseudomonadota bacterium]